MWSDKVRQQKLKARESMGHERFLLCTKCGDVLRDCEPMTLSGEFIHHSLPRKSKKKECPNAGKTFDWNLEPELYTLKDGTRKLRTRKGRHVSGIIKLFPKAYRRARKRGAKRASKHRPK